VALISALLGNPRVLGCIVGVVALGVIWMTVSYLWSDYNQKVYDRGFKAGEIEGFGNTGADGEDMSGGFLAGFNRAVKDSNAEKLATTVANLQEQLDTAKSQLTEANRIADDRDRRMRNAWAENARLLANSSASDRVCLSDGVVRDRIEFSDRLWGRGATDSDGAGENGVSP